MSDDDEVLQPAVREEPNYSVSLNCGNCGWSDSRHTLGHGTVISKLPCPRCQVRDLHAAS